MGLADELKSSQAGEAPAQAEQQTFETPAEFAEIEAVVPEHGGVHPEQRAQEAAPVEQQAQTPQAEKESTATSGKIKILDKEFESKEEAIAYAQDLAAAQLKQEAFQAGVEAAKPKQDGPKEQSLEEKIGEMFFDNPEEALRQYRDAIITDVKSTIKTEATQEAQLKETWDGFYKENPDLANNQELVNYVMTQNWEEVGYVDLQTGLQKIAEKARIMLASHKDAAMQRTEMPQGAAQMSGATGTPVSPAPVRQEKKLDFVSQVKKHYSKPGRTTA